jgi:methylated-DNA-[protein]-cysteine S-methyltransferase
MKLWIDRIETGIAPIGTLLLVTDGQSLCALDFADTESRLQQLLAKHYPQFNLIEQENPQGFSDCLRAYFRGDWHSLEAIPVRLGGTAFQQQVWSELQAIPVGESRSYGQLAARLGKPGAARAVGLANSLNPVAIVLPCHRVIGASGQLTGYAGGLERKRWLLAHEQSAQQLQLE